MNSSRNFTFGVNAFDCAIWVQSDSEEIRSTLNRFLLPPLARRNVSSDAADIKIAVLNVPSGFDVLLDEQKVCTAETLGDAALAAVKALDEVLVQKLETLRAVHAGAVVLKGRALLIPGSSHAGKSSLVAELLRRGAEHLSDEYALVDEEGRVHSYPRPLLLRNGGPKQTLTLPEDLDASFAVGPFPVGWIVAVDYVPEATWSVQQISQGEAVMLLLSNTPHQMGQSPEMINLFTRSAARAECYAGTRGDAVEAAVRVLELISDK